MAGSLLLLLDDIATVLDDVAALTKVAAKKTAGVLGDDLALNAQQVAGVRADREWPVVWAVAKGSFLNKLILVPTALLLSALAPWSITPLLMAGGLFLCFEGFEKVAHRWLHPRQEHAAGADASAPNVAASAVEPMAAEKDKVRGAVRTDFILSTEIVVITLGTVQTSPLATQVGVLAGVAAAMTVGVYGLVALIVKLDDLGLYLSRAETGWLPGLRRQLGRGLLALAPKMMRGLAVLGTLAMFLVGGGIVAHGIHPLGHALDAWAATAGTLAPLVATVFTLLLGFLAGALTLAGVQALQAVGRRLRPASR